MYSVLLLAAMSTNTAEAPAWRHSCGCTGAMYMHSGYYNSCIGCLGWSAYSGCSGSYGGCSGCYGGAAWYGWGGGCYGCMGCYGVYTGPVMNPAGSPMTAPTAPPPPATPPAGSGGTPPGKAAQLIIEKPADAKVFVDNLPVKSDGTTLTFATPTLDPNQAYYYMVRAERDGKPLGETRRVIVRAGQSVTETFREPGIVTASLPR